MSQGNWDQQLRDALLEAGLEVKTVEIRRGKKVVTVEKMKTKTPERPLKPVFYTAETLEPGGFRRKEGPGVYDENCYQKL
jgi:hypothetical protein